MHEEKMKKSEGESKKIKVLRLREQNSRPAPCAFHASVTLLRKARAHAHTRAHLVPGKMQQELKVFMATVTVQQSNTTTGAK